MFGSKDHCLQRKWGAMLKIKIVDKLNAEIISADAGPGSGFAKYFTGDVAGFIASSEIVKALNKPISSFSAAPIGLGLSFQNGGSFGNANVEWELAAGAQVTVQIAQANKEIPGESLFGNPLTVGADQAFLGIAIRPELAAGVSSGLGDLSFGFNAGGSIEFRAGRAFEVRSATPTLQSALQEVLTAITIPGDLADIKAMQPGDVVSVSGAGEIRASASFDLAVALNPLATPTLGLKQIGSLGIKVGASFTVGAGFGIRGSYQIRVARLDNDRVSVGYYRMRGKQFELDLTASAGVGVSLGERDLIELLASISSAPKADVVSLVESGLSNEQIETINSAIAASINRSLSVSLAASFSSASENSAVFEYEFALNELESDGVQALNFALDGNISSLTERRQDQLPKGVTIIESAWVTFRKKATSWRINLLGIVNILKVTELIRTGKVMFDPETGDLLITDTITANKISINTRPFAADSQKLRKVLMQSMILTAAYRVSEVQKFIAFNGTMTYFEQTGNVRGQNISDFLDNFVGLDLCTSHEKTDFLKGIFAGRASVFLEVNFDDAAFTGMFFTADGEIFSQKDYDNIGKQCVLKIVQPGDENEFRRIPMLDDALWQKMVQAGSADAMRSVMPAKLKELVRFQSIFETYLVIRWWSKAMNKAAEEIVNMKNFLKASGADAETLRDDNEFKKQLAKLEKSLSEVVSQSQPDSLDAWGVLAMDAAAQSQTEARGILLTSSDVLVKNRN